LPVVAHIAHHFFDFVSVHFMCLGIIVAVAARVYFAATRRHQAASAHIVFATVMCFFFFFFFFFFNHGIGFFIQFIRRIVHIWIGSI
jgi:hypothetical protein